MPSGFTDVKSRRLPPGTGIFQGIVGHIAAGAIITMYIVCHHAPGIICVVFTHFDTAIDGKCPISSYLDSIGQIVRTGFNNQIAIDRSVTGSDI